MSCEYEAADEMVRTGLKGMETGVRILESSTEHLARAVYSYIYHEKKTKGMKGGQELDHILRQRKALKAYALFDEDVEKFTGLAKLYGVKFFLIKDESLGDAITDILVEESDANKMSHIYERLSLRAPQRVRPGGPSPIFQAEEMPEEEKAKVRKPPILKKTDVQGKWKRTLEQKLQESERRAYLERKYALPRKPEKSGENPDKKEREME